MVCSIANLIELEVSIDCKLASICSRLMGRLGIHVEDRRIVEGGLFRLELQKKCNLRSVQIFQDSRCLHSSVGRLQVDVS